MPDSMNASPDIPLLETERLRLRGPRPSDFANSAALWGDPEVTRYVGGKPLTKEDVWARLLRYVGHWTWMGYGLWVVEEKATGQFVGEVGFANHKRAIEPPLTGMPEMGWVLAPHFHGKGYATEAVRAASAWGDSRFHGARTACIIHPENLRSIRVAEKCGFHQWQLGTYRDKPTLIFTR
jgi:RimJ/RimL family protein N-acetyltransferase